MLRNFGCKYTNKSYESMRNITRIFWCCVALLTALLTACQADDSTESPARQSSTGVAVRLQYADYDNASTRSEEPPLQQADYDRVEICVVDESGYKVDEVKGRYDAATSEIRLEGLLEGNYRLLLLGIRGSAETDGVSILPIHHADDEWLHFPADLQRPLEAEYFYSQTPFTVLSQPTAEGNEHKVLLDEAIVQKRIIGRADFTLTFQNPYVETALQSQLVTLTSPHFRTGFTGNGSFVGESDGLDCSLNLASSASYLFPPTVDGQAIEGEVEITTRNYQGYNIQRTYAFSLEQLTPNHIGRIHTQVVHPDDEATALFVTEQALDRFGLEYILQDDEPKAIYTDPAQRTFNTARPMQVSITDTGQLHVRFYSPREVRAILIQARIPALSDEYFDLAYFDRVPAFADFYGQIPASSQRSFCRTESGRILELDPISTKQWAAAEFRITSTDPYWEKLQKIQHGWNIGFELYGGNPDQPNGGPVGNWMGIRPVHCREVVALFLNFTYMIDMPEHEEILRQNADRLYGNGGVNDKVSVETVLAQMRQSRSLRVGLVYAANGVVGLGGGNVFGAYQQAWFEHYYNTYSCEIMFHELGHVMGYNHDSSFTYGPWAQELMNHFYVNHLSELPIDSPSYLNSAKNPNKY